MTEKDLDGAIRRVNNFPKPGVCFYDITSVLANPEAFAYCVDRLSEIVKKSGADAVGAVEARGFVFASAIAYRLCLPFVLIRKKGKLPNACQCNDFDLEYGSDTICIQELDLIPGRRLHLIDDLIATGGTLGAICNLIENTGLEVAGISAVIGLPFLGYPRVLSSQTINTLINFQTE